MAENTPIKNAPIRDDKGKFLPGGVPNPKGRPRTGLAAAEIARKVLDAKCEEKYKRGDVSKLEALFEHLWEVAMGDKGDKAARLLLEYGYGKPVQPVAGVEGQPLLLELVVRDKATEGDE